MEDNQEVMSIAAVEDWFAKQIDKSIHDDRTELLDVWRGISKELEDRQKQIDVLLYNYTQLATTVIAACDAITEVVKK